VLGPGASGRGCGRSSHGQAVGREDERRDLGAQLLGRPQRRAVQLRALPRLLQRDLERERSTIAGAGQRDPGGRGADPDELLVGARPGREALRAQMQRFEQVRLAGTVRAGDEHEARLQPELQPFVGAEVAKGDCSDDQARFLTLLFPTRPA